MQHGSSLSSMSGGAAGRVVPWLAAVSLHGGVAALLALAPAAPSPIPVDTAAPDPLVVEVLLVPPQPPALPAPPPPQPPALPAPPQPASSDRPAPDPVPPPVAVPPPAPHAPPVAAPVPVSTPPPAPEPRVQTAAVPAPRPGPAAESVAAPSTPGLATPAEWRAPGLANPPPAYPRAARLAGREGRVVLRVVVSAAGLVDSLHVVASSGVEALDTAAVRAVRQWRFRPAVRNGQAVADVVEVPVVFRLR